MTSRTCYTSKHHQGNKWEANSGKALSGTKPLPENFCNESWARKGEVTEPAKVVTVPGYSRAIACGVAAVDRRDAFEVVVRAIGERDERHRQKEQEQNHRQAIPK